MNYALGNTVEFPLSTPSRKIKKKKSHYLEQLSENEIVMTTEVIHMQIGEPQEEEAGKYKMSESKTLDITILRLLSPFNAPTWEIIMIVRFPFLFLLFPCPYFRDK